MALRDFFKTNKPRPKSASSAAKFGVLTFSYSNAKNFARSVEQKGFFSLNLGDYMQTLAARRVFTEIGVGPDQVVDIDRDTIASYDGEPVAVLMSAVFFPWSFPIPEQIIPIFLGFHASEQVIKANAEYFKLHQPIGCRDTDTTEIFHKYGIEAFTSGCVTMTFDQRPETPAEPRTFFVLGGGAGAFPAPVIAAMPTHLVESSEFVFQRKIVHRHPLTRADMQDAERYARVLLDEYRSRATLVVTPLHHAATPCISSGIPVAICRQLQNTRFSFLREFMEVQTAPKFDGIEWSSVTAPDIGHIRSAFLDAVRKAVDSAARGERD